MTEAGATLVAFVGPDGLVERSATLPLEEVVARLSAGADVVVVEGYRDELLVCSCT
jgi:molybdopterin-guanine dinucleotide biosynthesis protein